VIVKALIARAGCDASARALPALQRRRAESPAGADFPTRNTTDFCIANGDRILKPLHLLLQGIVGRIFFFPAFTRYFKKHKRLRIFAATIAAATIGNMIFHFLKNFAWVAEVGLWRALVGFQEYAFYATALGLGIGISQLRNADRKHLGDDAPWWRRALAAGASSHFSPCWVFSTRNAPTVSARTCGLFCVCS
jgi:hypothetical protein